MADKDPRVELEELRRLDELESKAAGREIDTSKLTDPHEIDFVNGRKDSMSHDDMAEVIRQYRAIKKADQGKPTMGATKIHTTPPLSPFIARPQEPTTIPPQAPPVEAEPRRSLLTPRLGMEDLKGASGQSALASALAMGAMTPGHPVMKALGALAGGAGSLLADEATRRLQEQYGEVPGGLLGLVGSLLTGGGIARLGRTPSHPTQFKNVTVDSPETQSFTIPPSEGLYESIPRGGAYSTDELLTPPGSRISPERQFSTGTGESLFGPYIGRIDQPTPGPMGGEPIATPLAPKSRLWQYEGIPSENSFTPRLDEKYPTLEPQPTKAMEVTPKAKGESTAQPIKAAGVEVGQKGPTGEYVPPKDYIEPPTPNKWRQMWNAEKERWGQELPVLKTHPDSPVISNIESTHVYVEDHMEDFVKQPWVKSLMKFGDNAKFAPLEKKWVEDFKAGRESPDIPDDFKQMFSRMKGLLDEENAINRRRGLPEVKGVEGPYAPRMTDEDFKLMRSIARSQEGAKTAQTIGSFGENRTLETLAEGLGKGVTYKDWRTSLLLREARGAVVRSTDQMMTDLEKQGVIFKDKTAAEAASLNGKAYAADGLPYSPKGGTWWVRSPEERQFLLQNLRQMGSGTLADIRSWAQQWLRNPSLVNPWPHIVKNMGLKQMQQAVAGGLNPMSVMKQSYVYRWGKPDMLEEFKQVMPFTSSGQTAWEIMEKAGPKNMVQQMSRVPGLLNQYARRKIFAEWDPAMRYGLWREYVKKGMSPQEAANNTWIDLIRYGTRADRIDAWNSVPFNFFVPWRVGTLRTMNKALQSAPVRFGLFMGAVDTIREMDYRYNNRWTHLPYDYIERPLMTLIKEGKTEALTTLASTLVAGPGGEYMFRTIQNILNEAQGKGAIGDVRTIAWGLAQVYDLWPQYKAWEKDHDPRHITDMLGLVALGRHATPYGAPHRLGELIPENLIRKSPAVGESEALREAVQQHSEVKRTMKQMRDVEKYSQPWEQAK